MMHDGSRLSARITTPAALDADEIAMWDLLSGTVADVHSPFLSRHYAGAVASAGREVRVAVLRDAQGICGFLPYQFPNRLGRWAKAAQPVGAEMTDYFGLIAKPGLRIDVAELLDLAGINYLGFSHLDETQIRLGLTGEQPRIGLRIRLDTASGQALEALQPGRNKYFKDTERRSRQLTNEIGPMAFTFDVQEQKHALLEQLLARKRAQYRRTNAPDALGARWKSELLHTLADFKYSSCRGILSTLSAGGKWLAMHFGIAGNGVLQYWLPVYNPELAKYAPGRLLIHHIIQSASSAAIHTIDRGEGDTPSKRELANEEHRFFRGAWHNRSAASRLTRGFQSIKWRLGA